MIRFRGSIFSTVFLVMLAGAACAQTPLPEIKKEYFDKGLSAAQRQRWDEAFDNFKQALGSTSEYAPVYFNMGLVFEKVGAPLEAAACLQAYLALVPNAVNAEAVRKEISRLKQVRSAQIDAIFQRVTESVQKLDLYRKTDTYIAIAKDYAQAGQIGKAIDLVKLMRRDDDNPIDRVPDLHIPDPWIHYAATLLAGDLIGSFFSTTFSELGMPEAAQKLLSNLDTTFPIPAPIGNPNDRIATKIDAVFKERSEKINSLRKYVAKALSRSPSTAPKQSEVLSTDAERQITFANHLISRSSNLGSIYKQSFDLEARIKSELDPKSDRDSCFRFEIGDGGPEYATAVCLSKVAAEFGAEAFLFDLLERGATAVSYAVEGAAVEEALWKSVQDSKNADRFRGYLTWFPKGKYAELADLSMKKLQAESKLAAPPPPPETVPTGEALRRGREALQLSNYPEAMRWFRAAADRGDAGAQTQVGWMHSLGMGVPHNDAEALRWYRKAADQGYATAELHVGMVYEKGAAGTPKDPEEALRWYRRAADKGERSAQLYVGGYYEKTHDYAEAMKWYLKAETPYAHMALGRFYEEGLGVTRDLEQAAYWYRRVANAKGSFMEQVGLDALKRIGARP